MAYSKSRARKAFEAEIDRCLRVIRRAHTARMRNKQIREYVLTAAIIRSSARIEAYVEDIISDWVAEMNLVQRMTDALPASIRVRHLPLDELADAFKHFVVYKDESQLITSLRKVFGNGKLAFALSGVACPPLSGIDVWKNKKYPSPDNVKAVFGRLGIDRVFAQLNRLARTDVQLMLQSFNDVRNELAHDGLPVGRNARDVKKKLSDAMKIVGHMDRLLYRHMTATGGPATWRT